MGTKSKFQDVLHKNERHRGGEGGGLRVRLKHTRTYLWSVFLSTSGRVSEIYVDFREGLEIHLHVLSLSWLSDLPAFRFFPCSEF